jgi:CheY-like chemotaxis protein
MIRVLVVEDGSEYVDLLSRFLVDGFVFERAGSGAAALERLGRGGVDVVFLDMRFDRVPEEALLGDRAEAADRFNGDPIQARRFLENNQGAYILAAIREQGHATPVLMSHDLSREPRRRARLRERFGPLDDVPDGCGPAGIATRLRGLASA